MNNELLKALRPVKRRVRRNRLLRGAAWGLAAGLGAALIVRIIALLTPVEGIWLWALASVAAFTLSFAAGNALRPVADRTAAQAADGCGLKERAITALEQAGSETEICALQREDACRALQDLEVRKIRTGSVRKQLLAALGCGMLVLVLLLIPSPRDREAEARSTLRRILKEGTEEIDKAAAEDEERLTSEQRSELRKLTEDLKRELLDSRDETDALVALDRAEQRLEQMENRTAGEALAAADGKETENNAGEGNENGDAADGTGTTAAGKTAQASGNKNSIRTGKLGTRTALEALKSAVNPAEAKKGAQTSAAGLQEGAGQGEGQSGQGNPTGSSGGNKAANGAGEGSTNLEQEGGGKLQGGLARGNREPKYKEAEYETIYDPERTDISVRDEMTNQNRLENEDSLQAETGPGKGNLGGSVPWDKVFREYEETETMSAGRENLTTKERQWVNDYYSLLTGQQE